MGGKLSKWTKADATTNASAKVKRGKSDVGHSQPRKSPQKVNKSADQPGTPVENENAEVTLNTADLLREASVSGVLKDVTNNLKEEESNVSNLVKEETNKILENTSSAINNIKESAHEGAGKVESVVESAVSKVNEITGGNNKVTVDKSMEQAMATEMPEVSSDVQMSMNLEPNMTAVLGNDAKEEKKEVMESTENDKSNISINLPSLDSGLSTFKSSAIGAMESISTTAENAKTTAEQFVNETLEETKAGAMNVANNVIESVPFLEKSEEKTAEAKNEMDNVPGEIEKPIDSELKAEPEAEKVEIENKNEGHSSIPTIEEAKASAMNMVNNVIESVPFLEKSEEKTAEAKSEVDNFSGEIEKPIDSELKTEPEAEKVEIENKNEGHFSMPTIDNNFIQENIQSITEKSNKIIESGEATLNSAIANAENAINDKAEQLFGTTVFSTQMDKVDNSKSESGIKDTTTGLESKPDEAKIEGNLDAISNTEERKVDVDAMIDQKESDQHDAAGLPEIEGTISLGNIETSKHTEEIKMPESSDVIGESKSENVDEVKSEEVCKVESNVVDEYNAANESQQNNEIKSEHKETESESCDISIKEIISNNLNTETVDKNQSIDNSMPTEVVNANENVHELPDSIVDEKASEIVDTTIEQAKAEVVESFESNELPAPPESKPACDEETVLERQQSDTVIENMDDKRISEFSLPDPPVMTNTTLSNGFDGPEESHLSEINKPNGELLNKIVDSETTIKICPKADLEEKLTKYLKTKNLVEDSVEADRLIKQFLDTLDISDLEASVNRCTTQLFDEIKQGEITEDSRTDLVSLLLKTSS